MKICVIGLGYIGLPTSAIFANSQIDVIGVDVNKEIVNILNQGKIHIEEPGLEDIIKKVITNGKFIAKLEPEQSDVFIIAVPTPNKNDEYLSCDLTYVENGIKSILPYIKKGDIVIIESTISPRATEDTIKPILEQSGFIVGKEIFLAHCPERVLPGQILKELVNNNRIVGGITNECSKRAIKVYEKVVKGKIIKTNAKTAEMSKLMENTFRDVNIALANELTKICDKLDVNTLEVIEMANEHPRVNIHSPGPGVGGHCLAVDPYFIYAKAVEQSKLIKTARDINVSMPNFVIDKIEKILKNDKKEKICILGVTYKGNVDDTRESPALNIIGKLKKLGYNLSIHDPYVKNDEYVKFNEAIKDSSLIVVLVDHREFKNLNEKEIYRLSKKPIVFDTKGCVEPMEKVKLINYGNISKI